MGRDHHREPRIFDHGLRLIAAARGKVLPAERLGKHKTVWQIVTIVYCLALAAISEQFGPALSPPVRSTLDAIGVALICFTVALTLWSGISYFAKNWDLVKDL